MSLLRLFVALDLPPVVKTQLGALTQGIPQARWVAPRQMHLTLHFIGEVPDSQVTHIHTALSAVTGSPFELALRGVGIFPPKGAVRVLWAGVAAPPALADLHQRLGAALQTTGCEPDARPFAPHITLARFATPPAPAALNAYRQQHHAFATPAFNITEVVLFESQRTTAGVQYEPLYTYPLITDKP